MATGWRLLPLLCVVLHLSPQFHPPSSCVAVAFDLCVAEKLPSGEGGNVPSGRRPAGLRDGGAVSTTPQNVDGAQPCQRGA